MRPHKHADLIHAWADGAKIQELNDVETMIPFWFDQPDPKWQGWKKFRVKPEPVVLYVNEYEGGYGGAFTDKEIPSVVRATSAYGDFIRTIKLQEVEE